MHNRVVILTDEQLSLDSLGGTLDSIVPAEVPIYSWNLGGYKHGARRGRSGSVHASRG